MVFDTIWSNLDKVLSINPSVNVFFFGDLNDLTQIANFCIWFPDCHSHSHALFDLFLFSDASSICSTMTFPPLGNSDHVIVSVSTAFPSNSNWEAPFHHLAYDYSCADWWMVYMII